MVDKEGHRLEGHLKAAVAASSRAAPARHPRARTDRGRALAEEKRAPPLCAPRSSSSSSQVTVSLLSCPSRFPLFHFPPCLAPCSSPCLLLDDCLLAH